MAAFGMMVPGTALVSMETFYVSAAFVQSGLFLVMLTRGRHTELRPFLCIALATTVLGGFGDVVYAIDSLSDVYWNGGGADGLYALAAAAYFYGCVRTLPDDFLSVPRPDQEEHVLRQSYVYVPVAFILLGILVASHVAEWSYTNGLNVIESRLESETGTKSELLQQLLVQEQSQATAFAAYLSGSSDVSKQAFDRYADSIFSSHGDTADYSFVNNEGVIVSSTEASFVGRSPAAAGMRTEDTVLAQQEVRQIASPPVVFLNGEAGFQLTAPVFRAGEESFSGVLISTVRLADALAPLITTFDRETYTYTIASSGRVMDAGGRSLLDPQGGRLTTEDVWQEGQEGVVETGDDRLAERQTAKVTLLNRPWTVTVESKPDALRRISTTTLLLFLMVLLFCCALAAIAYFWLSTHARMTRDLDEKTKSLRGKIEELSQAQYFLDHVSEAVVVADQDWRIVYANRAASDLSIHPDHALVGKQFWTHILTELDEQRTHVQESIERQGRFEGELQVMSRAGGSRDQWLTIQPLPKETGRPNASIALLRDITERKNVERAKSAFVSLVAHQLRTPMTQLRWMTETLLLGKLSKAVRETLTQIQGIVLVENQLVSDLLNVSRIERGVLKMTQETVPLPALLKETFEPLIEPAAARHVHIALPTIREDLRVAADGQKFSEALRNVGDNAVKYTPDGGQVRVEVQEVGDRVEISVSDQGAGVPEEIWDTLFDIKYTPTVNATQTSTGLGLYLTKRFVEAMGGTIRFTSSSSGATFIISLARA
jgi:two-component system phosphate regulon sensor histidine kinase PhoR